MEFNRRKSIKTASLAVMVSLSLFCGAGISYTGQDAGAETAKQAMSAKSQQHPCHGNQGCGEKWMIGDFHNHTTYTDGSWPMNDLTGPATIATSAHSSADGLYKQGTADMAWSDLWFYSNPIFVIIQ